MARSPTNNKLFAEYYRIFRRGETKLSFFDWKIEEKYVNEKDYIRLNIG